LLASAHIADTPVIVPVIYVGWWPGLKDNHRTSDGEVHWETIEEAGWSVSILDWKHYDPPQDASGKLKGESIVDDFVVYMDDKALGAGGTFVVDGRDGELSIVHQQ